MVDTSNKQGSTWKKWDLHIHTPASFNWQGDDDYQKVIAKINSCDAEGFVVSDYWTFEGYKELVKTNELLEANKRLNKSVLPGIELRFDFLTDGNDPQRVNFQVVINNEGNIDEIFARLDQFYGRLKLCNTDKIISRNSFVELAKDYSDDVLKELVGKTRGESKEKDYFLAGRKRCYVSYDCIFEILKDKELSKHILIIVPWDKYGGINKIDPILRDDVKKKLTKLASFVESSNQETKKLFLLDKAFLSDKSWATSWQQFLDDKQKPCVCGSDSHSVSTYGNSLCWIKSDLTFEGLKQVIYEPEDRVKIQANNPYLDRKKVMLSNIVLEGSTNFVMPDVSIPLNRDLVTLIGGRGSGKSALLESVAFLNEEHEKEDQNGKKKIIEYFRNNLDGKEPPPGFTIKLQLTDKDGAVEEFSKPLSSEANEGLPFLYIGQEQLGSLATNDKVLTEKICSLLNINVAELDTSYLKEKARQIISQIDILSSETRDLVSKYPDFEGVDFDKWIGIYIKQKEEQKGKLSSSITKSLLEKISKSIERGLKLKTYKNEITELSDSLERVSVNEQIETINKKEKELYGKSAEILPLITFSLQKTAIRKKLDKVEKEMSELRNYITQLKTKLSSMGLKEDISVLLQSTENIQNEINNAVENKNLYKKMMVLAKNLIAKRDLLYREILYKLKAIRDIINSEFANFVKSRSGSTEEEKKLFDDVIKGIGIEGDIVLYEAGFCKYLLDNCVDKRGIKSNEEVKALVSGRDNAGKAKDITLDTLQKWIEVNLESFLNSEALNTSGASNLVDYLFTEWDRFLSVRAIVKLYGVPTEKLSVGQRGTLLLKIYLATASVKQIFIVDQPEDNLDNAFIMHELVPLIRQVKKSRQIILSTHNANLVVNADSEQVIVAKLDKGQGYISGSIENPEINTSIKEVLEGGETAFRNRESKYGMGSLHP